MCKSETMAATPGKSTTRARITTMQGWQVLIHYYRFRGASLRGRLTTGGRDYKNRRFHHYSQGYIHIETCYNIVKDYRCVLLGKETTTAWRQLNQYLFGTFLLWEHVASLPPRWQTCEDSHYYMPGKPQPLEDGFSRSLIHNNTACFVLLLDNLFGQVWTDLTWCALADYKVQQRERSSKPKTYIEVCEGNYSLQICSLVLLCSRRTTFHWIYVATLTQTELETKLQEDLQVAGCIHYLAHHLATLVVHKLVSLCHP